MYFNCVQNIQYRIGLFIQCRYQMRIEGQARLEVLSATDDRLALGPTQPRTRWQLRVATAEGKQSGNSFSNVLCYGFDGRGLIPDRDRFFFFFAEARWILELIQPLMR